MLPSMCELVDQGPAAMKIGGERSVVRNTDLNAMNAAAAAIDALVPFARFGVIVERHVDRHCCVERSGCAVERRRVGVRSDRGGELVEGGSETNTLMPGFDDEFIMSASQVLDERVTADHR